MSENHALGAETALKLYEMMCRIRFAEEGIAEHYSENKMRCPTHLSIGQEAVPAAASAALRKDDFAVSTHRCHAHYLGKGGSLKRMIAEIYGKATGCSFGRGGSMHLIDLSAGFMGSTAIVGNSIPLGVGLALSAQLKGTDQVSVIYLGDGAVETGLFAESANFSAVRKLPVLFLCENNMYSVYSHLKVRQPEGRKIHELAAAFGMESHEGDGNDVEESYSMIRDACARIRSGKGPQFLELHTYRWREHCGPNYDNNIGYRTEDEFLAWKEKDPVAAYRKKLLQSSVATARQLESIEEAIHGEVKEAFHFAETSPWPEPREAFLHLFKETGGPS